MALLSIVYTYYDRLVELCVNGNAMWDEMNDCLTMF